MGGRVRWGLRSDQEQNSWRACKAILKNLVFTLGISGSPGGLKDKERYGERCGICMYNGILLSHERNEIGSFVEMWVELEPIIQSEVCQKEQNKCILMHTCGI